jgi:hypothetical protein
MFTPTRDVSDVDPLTLFLWKVALPDDADRLLDMPTIEPLLDNKLAFVSQGLPDKTDLLVGKLVPKPEPETEPALQDCGDGRCEFVGPNPWRYRTAYTCIPFEITSDELDCRNHAGNLVLLAAESAVLYCQDENSGYCESSENCPTRCDMQAVMRLGQLFFAAEDPAALCPWGYVACALEYRSHCRCECEPQ